MQTSNQWCWEGAEPKGLPEEKCPSQGMLLQLHQSQPTVGLVHILMGGVCVHNSSLLCIPSNLLFAASSPPKGHPALSAGARTQLCPKPRALRSITCCHPQTPSLPHIQAVPGERFAPLMGGGILKEVACEEGLCSSLHGDEYKAF